MITFDTINKTVCKDNNIAKMQNKLRFSKLKSNLDSGEFEPITTPLCGWCSFVAECPAGTEFIKKRASSGKLRSDAPARSALGL